MKGMSITDLSAHYTDRGWNIHPLDEALLAEGWFKNIHLVSMSPGTMRGSHYHSRQTEHVVPFGGPCRVVAKNQDTDEHFDQVFEGAPLQRLSFDPGVPHVFVNIGGNTIFLLCATDLPFDPSDIDSIPYNLLE